MRATCMGCLPQGEIERGLPRQLKMAIRLPHPLAKSLHVSVSSSSGIRLKEYGR